MSPAGRHQPVDHLAVLINGSVHVAPHTGDLHVGLVDKPAATHSVTAGVGGVDQYRREPLHPPVHGHVIDDDPTFGQAS